MIRNIKTLDGFDVREWQNNIQSDEDDMTWIWNQLMGETAKGDTRPTLESSTKEDTIEPGTETLSISADVKARKN